MIDLGPTLARHGLALADMLGALPPDRFADYARRDAVLRDLAEAGHSSTAIGAALGIGREAIAARCRRAGIKLPRRAARKRGWAGTKPRETAPVEPAATHLRLVPPLHPWASGARQADCASLGACEEAWIQGEIRRTGMSGGQAWCPRRCAGFALRGEGGA